MPSEAPIHSDEPRRPADRVDRLRAAFDALTDAVWLLDAVRDGYGEVVDFRVDLVNRRGAELAGITPEEARGRLVSEIAPAARDLGHLTRYAKALSSDRPVEFEFRLDADDAPPVWRWVTASPLGDGVVVTLRDITARVLSERRRAASEADYRLLAENATDMIARVTPDGLILYVSPACREILGVEPAEMVGRADWEFAHPDDAPALRAGREGLSDGTDVRRLTYRGRRRGGGWVWLESTARPVHDAGGTVMEIQVATRDISERALADAEHAALHRVSEAVAAGLDADDLYRLVAVEMARVLEADGGRVVRYVEGDGGAEVLGAWRRSGPPPVPAGARITMDQASAIGRVRATGRTAVTEITTRAPEVLPFAIAAPVCVTGRLWGAVAAAYASSSDAPAGVAGRVERFAKLVSLAVADAEARARLERQARTDALTGLANHAAFHAALASAVERAQRYGGPLALVLIDLDHFKALNDTFGHRAGDEALARIGALMREHARRVDVVGRVGGEEFAWLMPDTGVAGAAEAGERLRRAIASAALPDGAALTASLGAVEWSEGDGDAEGLFRRADAALFAAKGAGRDRVEAA